MASLKTWTVLFFLIVPFPVVSAQNKGLDSLQQVLKNYPKRDTVRVNLLNKIGTKTFNSEFDKALSVFKEAEEIAEEINYKKGKAYSVLFIGNTLFNKSKFPEALDHFEQAKIIYEQLKNKEGLANCYFNFGRVQFKLGDLEKATFYYENCESLCEETGDKKRLSTCLNALGLVYSRRDNYDKSEEYYKKSIQLDEKLGNKRGMSNTLTNLGTIYKKKGEYAQALESYKKAMSMKEEANEMMAAASISLNIGTLYSEMDNEKEANDYYAKALTAYQKLNNKEGIATALLNIGTSLMKTNVQKAKKITQQALTAYQELNDPSGIAKCLSNLGVIDLQSKNYKSAIVNLEKGIKFCKENDMKRDLSFCYLKIGRVYFEQKEFETALKYANLSLIISKEMDYVIYQRDANLLLADIYYETKQYKLAYEKSNSHKELQDSLFSKTTLNNLAEVKYKYEFADSLNKAKEVASTLEQSVQNKDFELNETKSQKSWLISGTIALIFILLCTVFFLRNRRIKMKKKQLLTEQKLLLSQMNPHFIFNSIENIQSLIYNKKDTEAVDYLTRFSQLTRQILENSTKNYISLSEEIDIITDYLSIQQLLYAHKFNFDIQVEHTIDTEATFIPPMLTQPFVENAIKHGLNNRDKEGKINISFSLKDSKLFFEITDNGLGFGSVEKNENHKSLAISITQKRLSHYSENHNFKINTENLLDQIEKIVGAKVIFEIPYIYEK